MQTDGIDIDKNSSMVVIKPFETKSQMGSTHIFVFKRCDATNVLKQATVITTISHEMDSLLKFIFSNLNGFFNMLFHVSSKIIYAEL